MKLGGAHRSAFRGTESRLVVGYRVSVEIGSKQAQASFRGDENVLKPDCGKDLLKSLNYLNQMTYRYASHM